MKNLEDTVQKTLEEHSLIYKNERVAVACSGGKDSTTVLHILNELGYSPEALTIDLLIGDWSKKNLENLTTFCEQQGIALHVVSMRESLGYGMCYIRGIAKDKLGLNDCTTCGIIKKWLLNREAKERGFDVIATGHNLDDEAQTVLMNILHGKPELSAGLGPKTESSDGFAKRVKPLYFVPEKDVLAYSRKKRFPVLYERCPCSGNAFRREVRAMLDRLEGIRPGTKRDIVDNAKVPESKAVPGRCSVCGEPCRGDVCSACRIMEALHG